MPRIVRVCIMIIVPSGAQSEKSKGGFLRVSMSPSGASFVSASQNDVIYSSVQSRIPCGMCAISAPTMRPDIARNILMKGLKIALPIGLSIGTGRPHSSNIGHEKRVIHICVSKKLPTVVLQ